MGPTIKEVLMKRDEMASEEADALIAEAKEDFALAAAVNDLETMENICEYWFGLEPDYLDEFF